MLLAAAGLQGPYFRVIPKYLLAGLEAGLPVHRVVDSDLQVPRVIASNASALYSELGAGTVGVRAHQAELFSELLYMDAVPRAALWSPCALELASS